MSSRNKSSNIRQRLRHSDTTAQKSSPNSTKTFDVEPVKKRLRSAGDYKLNFPYEEPKKLSKSVSPVKKSPKKIKIKSNDRKSTTSSTKRKSFSPEARTTSPNSKRLTRSADKPQPTSSSSKKKSPVKSEPKPSTSKKVQPKKEIEQRPVASSSKSPVKSESKPSTSKKVQPKREIEQRPVASSSRRPTAIKVELPDGLLNQSKTPRGSIRFFEPDTPPVRNQNVFHNCAVCKESTLLLTNEYQDQLLKNEVKGIEFGAEDLTPTEDPALQCNTCKRPFHLVCVYDEIQIQNWALSNPKAFVCQECVRCSRCTEPIFDPGNVQCITCGNAFHEVCKPETQIFHDFPSLSRVWYCNICEESLLNIFDFKRSNNQNMNNEDSNHELPSNKRSNKRNLSQSTEKSKKAGPSRRSNPINDLNKSLDSPAHKKAKVDNVDSSPRTLRRLTSRPETSGSSSKVLATTPSPSKSSKASPIKNESPNRSARNKELSDEDLEKRRLLNLNRLKESIQYDGEFQCISAQESTFSQINEEYVDEEEQLDELRLEQFIPFGSVGNVAHKRNDRTDLTFFYGPIAYKPRFSQFLRMIYPEYDRLSFCRRCLIALPSPASLIEHNSACTVQNPPGTLIYQEKNLCIWEVAGKKEKTYSRRLSLFAKTFIGSKTVFFEVEQFNFYVLTETEGSTSIMAGYFSKEIKPTANNNLSCLLILPWMQRKGYGLFLIDLSYHLSLRERKIGSPEHPLSDAGLKTYRQYWYGVIMSYLREKIYHKEKIDLVELKEQKGIEMKDILETMIIADMTFILDNQLQINVETPLYAMLSSLRRRYLKPKLLQVKGHSGPFTTYN